MKYRKAKHWLLAIGSLVLPATLSAAMISSTNFEDLRSGTPMSRTLFQENGFRTDSWDNALESRTVIDSTQAASGLQSMRITYPAGGYGPEETGCQVKLMFDSREEAYTSYNLRFSENFSWGTTSYGGKLPGLCGGACCSGGDLCDGTNGFSARLMWRAGGKAVLYLYHMDKPDKYGEDHDLLYPDGSSVLFERGKWYHIAERVKINTDGDTYDGEVEIWVDGKQVLLLKGLRFTSNGDKVDNLYISTFHGGDDETWCPTETCYTWLDDIRIGTTYKDVAYQSCRKPELGMDKTLCTGSKSYKFAPDRQSDAFRYQWLRNGKRFSQDPSISVWEEGTYVLVADSGWCSGRDTVSLLSNLKPDLGEDRLLCATSFVTLQAGIIDDASLLKYEWRKDGALLDNAKPSLQVKDAGVYRLTVSSPHCESASDEVTVTSGLLQVRDVEGSAGTNVTLEVTGNGNYVWYKDSTLREVIGEGNRCPYTIPAQSSYLYVKDASAYTGYVGKKRLTTNAWTRTDFSEWMLFTVYRELTIDSISIYPSKNLTAVIRVLDDATGEVVSSRTFEGLTPGENRLSIGLTLAPGKYRMDAQGTTAPLYHSHTDDDIAFPYEIEGLISLDGANLAWINNKPWYLYFYDWRVSCGNVCAATPVLLRNTGTVSSPSVKDDHLTIYPKYTDGDLYIEGLSGKSTIRIFAPNGKKMISRRLKQPNAYFYLNDWKAGIYMIVIEDESGTRSRQILKF